MTTNNLKFWLGSLGAGIVGIFGIIAEMPPELQKQIAQPFPESSRGIIGLVFLIAAYFSHHYASAAARNALVTPVSVTMQTPNISPQSTSPVQKTTP